MLKDGKTSLQASLRSTLCSGRLAPKFVLLSRMAESLQFYDGISIQLLRIYNKVCKINTGRRLFCVFMVFM